MPGDRAAAPPRQLSRHGGTVLTEPYPTQLHPISLHRYPDAAAVGEAGARHAAEVLRAVPGQRTARVMLAAAPSQSATLRALAAEPGIDFTRVEFFHMDDYLGLAPTAPQGFGTWLLEHFINRLPTPTTFHRMAVPADPADAVRAAADYAAVMGPAPFDLTLCGLGVNAHLAFNDPPADFADPEAVRVVELSETSRQQQADEGHFATPAAVPSRALTVTIPRLLNTGTVIASVVGVVKHWAVQQTLARDLDPECPGTALKLHPDAHLYLDEQAFAGAG